MDFCQTDRVIDDRLDGYVLPARLAAFDKIADATNDLSCALCLRSRLFQGGKLGRHISMSRLHHSDRAHTVVSNRRKRLVQFMGQG